MAFRDKVYHMVEQIPKGKVATYGQIAFLCGKLRAARVVGNALHENPFEGCVPCHRVVNRLGATTPVFDTCSPDTQRALLEAEGVTFTKAGHVNLSLHLWQGSPL